MWNYAVLTHEVKSMGGPEEFKKNIIRDAYLKGFQKGGQVEKIIQNRKITIAFGAGVLGTIGSMKLVEYCKKLAQDERSLFNRAIRLECGEKDYLMQDQGKDETSYDQDIIENCSFNCQN